MSCLYSYSSGFINTLPVFTVSTLTKKRYGGYSKDSYIKKLNDKTEYDEDYLRRSLYIEL